MRSAIFPFALLAVAGCGRATVDLSPTDPPTPTTTTDTRVVTSGVIACEDPSARDLQPYDMRTYGEEWPHPPGFRTPAVDLGEGGRGVAVADFDGDGHLDILAPEREFATRLLWGAGDGTFVDAGLEPFGGTEVSEAQGVTVADIDGDGDIDAFLYCIDAVPQVLRNDGGVFTAIPHPEWTNPADPVECGGSASFADYDRDGTLDLFYGTLGVNEGGLVACPSFLLHGEGGGVYADHSDELPAEVHGVRVLASGWHDFDLNGWPDLYTISDCQPPPQPNILSLNNDGALAVNVASGMGVRLAGMGLAVGDLNGDEIPDAVVPGVNEYAALYSLEGTATWVESALAVGLVMAREIGQNVGWGLELADLDNDRDLDMPAVFGPDRGLPQLAFEEPDEIYLNQGDGTFVPVGVEWGFDQDHVKRGLVVADVDRNGWVDLIKRELGGVVFVHMARCGEASWLEVSLDDPGSGNPFAIGATIMVDTQGSRLFRTIGAGSTSYTSGNPPEAHFGLGDAEVVDLVEITWPDGEVDAYGPFDARQVLRITRD